MNQQKLETPSKYPENSIIENAQYKKKYEIQERLGHGQEGEVYAAKLVDLDPQKQKQIILKIDYKNITEQQWAIKDEFFEKLQQYQLKNKSQIITIHDYFVHDNKFVIIMDRGDENLAETISILDKNSYLQKYLFCLQITKSIQQLHQLGYFHRDLKPENFILINGEVKLIDFGQVKQITDVSKTIAGTGLYRAPEIINNQPYDETIDVWSLGCSFYFILTGQNIFQTIPAEQHYQSEVQTIIENNIQSQFWQTIIKSTIVPAKYRVKIDQLIKNITLGFPMNDVFINQQIQTQQQIQINSIDKKDEFQQNRFRQQENIKQQQFQQDTENEFQKYFIQYYPNQEVGQQLYTTQEIYEHDLKTYIQKKQSKLTQKDKLNICLQIAECINYLHKHQKVHRMLDLNCFVKAKQSFKFLNIDFQVKIENNPRQTKSVKKNLYSSPEIIYENASLHQSQDIWSLGMIFFEIMTGTFLYDDKLYEDIDKKKITLNQAFQQINLIIANSLIQFEMKILLSCLLVREPGKRLPIKVIIHFLKNIIHKNQIITFNFNTAKIEDKSNKAQYRSFIIQEQIPNGINQYKVVDLNQKISILKFYSEISKEQILIFEDLKQKQDCIKSSFFWQKFYVIEFQHQDTQNLEQYLNQKHQGMTLIEKITICQKILNVVQPFHQNQQVFGSLKLENFIYINGKIVLGDLSDLCQVNQNNINMEKPNMITDQFLDIYSLGQVFYKIFAYQKLKNNYEFEISFEEGCELFSQIENLFTASQNQAYLNLKILIKQMLSPISLISIQQIQYQMGTIIKQLQMNQSNSINQINQQNQINLTNSTNQTIQNQTNNINQPNQNNQKFQAVPFPVKQNPQFNQFSQVQFNTNFQNQQGQKFQSNNKF